MRIRKFNESNENQIDLDILDQCFIEFIDEGRYSRKIIDNIVKIQIKIDDKNLMSYKNPDINTYIENNKFFLEEYYNIKNCLDKLKTNYNEIYINFSLQDVTEHVDNDSKYYLDIKLTPGNYMYKHEN